MSDKPPGMTPPWPSPGYPMPILPEGSASSRRRWPAVLAAAAVGAVLAAVTTVLVTGQSRDAAAPTPPPPTPDTVTVAPPQPSPIPFAQADRATCQGWLAAGDLISSASTAQQVMPDGVTILDPQVRANPQWTAAVEKAGDLYQQAGDTLGSRIAPGTTPILEEAANTAAKALNALATSFTDFDAANGNAYDIADHAANEMAVLCRRLAP